MEIITQYVQNFDFASFWKIALILLLGTFLLSVFGRFVFGKRSALNHAVSSAIAILFIYAVTVVFNSAGADFSRFITPLPFVSILENTMTLFSFTNAHYTTVCAEILSMIILAFLVNLADGWLPKGKNIFSWLFFRCLTVVIAYILHLVVIWLFATYLPQGIVTYAPVILLGILVLLLLTGALKILVGAVLTTVNPIIGGLYTFFFATVIGKQITKAVLTTAILVALIFGLQYAGISSIPVDSSAMIGYLPFLAVLVVLWYIVIMVF